jgi:hypothetical protein
MTDIKLTRLRLGLSAAWCAERLAGGMSRFTYRDIESGKIAMKPDIAANMEDLEASLSDSLKRCAARTSKSKLD